LTSDPAPVSADEPESRPRAPVDWRRNLAALWFAQVTAIFGFSFAFPFLPVYLRQLGVHDAGPLALWSGVAGGAAGAALAVMSPIWGVLADRYGRRPMLLRAMIGAGITVGLMGFARGPIDLVALRLVQGATSGTVAAATALVASGTPRHRVGWALGVLTSAVAVGSALGPLVGGLAAAVFGVRAIFWGGGVLLGLATLPVLLVVREVPVKRSEEGSARSARELLREHAPGAIGAIAALLVCQALLQVAYSGSQPLVVLRLLEHLSTGVEAVTGVAFAAAGLASALASVAYVGIARRLGYRAVGVLAAALMASAQLIFAWGPGIVAIVGGATLAGLFYGTLGPVISTMIGLETPPAAQARVFGVGASATAVGFALGPLGGGIFAAQLGTSVAITLCAAAAGLLAIVLAARGREPAR
jgi:DHA1 family multidrug resistance protein-like MFS transporter